MSEAVVHIILINWNNYSDTIACLHSLSEIQYESKKIVLVDNASTDGSLQKIKAWADKNTVAFEFLDGRAIPSTVSNDPLTIISLDANLGFGGANNIGIRLSLKSNPDFILLLNNDTVVQKDFLSRMVRSALNNKSAGIVGGKIKYFDNKDKIWFNGGHVDFVRGAFYHCEDNCSGLKETDFITGCLMLLPSHIFTKVGYFDEDYFLNVEDVDLSYRVKDAGHTLFVDCDAVIYHKVSASIGGFHSLRNQYYFHRNRMRFFRKRLSGAKSCLFQLFQFIIAIPAWTAIQLVRGRLKAIKGAAFGYRDYMEGCFGKSRYF